VLRLITPVLLIAALAACVSAVILTRGAGATAVPAMAPAEAVAARAPAAPTPISPANDATVDSVPPFSWRRVRRAAEYEFQLSADPGFRSTLASFETKNTSATIDKTLFDGFYHWRVRAVNAAGTAGRWSRTRSLRKRWPGEPALLSPAPDAAITYPSVPLVLRWASAPHAAKYEVAISSDPSLAGNVVTAAGRPVEVRGTSLAFPGTLSPGRYYWAVTPLDAGGLKGRRSEVRSFQWSWPSETATRLTDLWGDADTATYVDPQFEWDPIPGAARYEVEVSTSQDFAAGSKVCCSDPTTGTSLSPTQLLGNNTDLPAGQNGYHWRIRGIDLDGNAGRWNPGQSFRKAFDDVIPTVPSLRVRDNLGNDLDLGEVTDSPVVDWDPVPGASSYEVHVVPWIDGLVPGTGGCDWNADANEAWGSPVPVATASTAWTPLAFSVSTPVPFSGFAREADKLDDGGSYCARVRARAGTDTAGKRVVSDWTTLGGLGVPGFTYFDPGATGPSAPLDAADYVMPGGVEVLKGMPLFTWEHIDGACGYFVAVARDQNFTSVVDVARTKIPAYAPRLRTYADETTSYYWAVLPVSAPVSTCETVFTTPQDNSPQTFQKRSNPPNLKSPAPGSSMIDQPTFRWAGNWPNAAAVEGAREYRLQVAEDPTFANLIDDVRTASTAYTSSSTYPADTEVFWRVRATDENGIGLNWSETGTFRRRLRIPAPSDSNPTRGQDFPVLTWAPVQGAVSYGFHLEEADGDKSDYEFRSTAASFVRLESLGALRWQVRANFPKRGMGTVPGGYSAVQTFTRFVDPPPNARLTSGKGRVLLNWDPSPSAHKYRVEFSETNSFTRPLEVKFTPNTNYAPKLLQRGFQDGGRLYWRIAAVDELNNAGGYATGSLVLPRSLRVRINGALVKRTRRTVTVMVMNAKNRPVSRARVRVAGAGVRARPRRTGRRGTVTFALRPRRSGNVTFKVSKRGYRTGKASTAVR
jgi:hypothetical protein